MKKRTFLIFIAYIWTKTLLGLTFSPYKSIKEMAKRPVLMPVIFSPFLGLIFLMALGKTGSLLITFYGLKREVIALFLSTALISILFWQILLFYLLGSFLFALNKK